MKTIFTIFSLLIFISFGYSQNKIDLLVKKYGESEIILYTTVGDLIGKPVVKKNTDGLPYSIVIGGYGNREKLGELFLSLFIEKEKEGFVLTNSKDLLRQNMNKNYITESILSGFENFKFNENGFYQNFDTFKVEYIKGKYIFKAKSFIEVRQIREENYGLTQMINYLKFEIEMIDKTRIGGTKSSKFKF